MVSGSNIDLSWKGMILTGLSGVLTCFAIRHVNFLLAWICLIPFFYVTLNNSKINGIKYTLFFGFILSTGLFHWMISAGERYSGGNLKLGMAGFIIAILIYTFFLAIVMFAFFNLKVSVQNKYYSIINAFQLSTLWILMEQIRFYLLQGFPFMAINIGYSIAGSNIAIQPVAITGSGILTGVIVFSNYLFTEAVYKNNFKWILKSIGVPIIYSLCGMTLVYANDKSVQTSDTKKIAFVTHNIAPDIIWDKNNEQKLAKIYIDLNNSAIKENPDLIIWTESAIPWKFYPDDVIVSSLTKASNSQRIQQLIGVNRPVNGTNNSIYNSAILTDENGIHVVYDKQQLLSLIEKPVGGELNGITIQMMGTPAIKVIPGPETGTINTHIGQAAVRICNEAIFPSRFFPQSSSDFYIVMGNDGWFENTYIPQLHFLICRLRAVELGRNFLVNINRGGSGLITSDGKILQRHQDTIPQLNIINFSPSKKETIANSFPDWFVFVSLIAVILIQFNETTRKTYKS